MTDLDAINKELAALDWDDGGGPQVDRCSRCDKPLRNDWSYLKTGKAVHRQCLKPNEL